MAKWRKRGSIVVIMVSIFEKGKIQFATDCCYSVWNGLKNITKKEPGQPGCRGNKEFQVIRDLSNLIDARVVFRQRLATAENTSVRRVLTS